MRPSSIFAIFCFAVGVSPSFAIPSTDPKQLDLQGSSLQEIANQRWHVSTLFKSMGRSGKQKLQAAIKPRPSGTRDGSSERVGTQRFLV
ncbi:hypothetical protein F5148DRAFT_1166973 [Russula earlei]|uniref:Uncharacterized protein n=1 Tax=Russula earlei TaxID=71964 RepID=A0ACC0ULB5_9AGAM|nr:hypothetical protein F5148DRAFT_1166973 [Russula earlei]